MKDKTFRRSFALSFLAHSILVLFLAFGLGMFGGKGSGNGKGKGEAGQEQGEAQKDPDKIKLEDFIEQGKKKQDETVEVTLMDQKDLFAILDKKKQEEEKLRKHQEEVANCPDQYSYGGVGLENGYQGTVEKVAEFYPAGRAGIRVGDYVENFYELRGEPGTKVVIRFRRAGSNETLQVEVTREKICYRPAAPKESTGP